MNNLIHKNLRKLVFTLLMLLTLSLDAQVKFLGIPVDGTKSDMIQNLIQKGYIFNRYKDYLMGEFNGNDVFIHVEEYKGKVGRIIVEDANPSNEIDIIIRYNNLIEQFENNGKYLGENVKIDNKTNIGYEMYNNHNRFEAVYYQKSTDDKDLEEDELHNRKVWFMIQKAEKANQGYKILIHYDNVSNMPNGEDL